MDQFDSQDDQNRSLDAPRPAPAPVPQGKMSFFTTPLSQQGWPVMAVYVAAVIGLLYLLNPTAGILELLPDNLPIVGNLDEGAAFLLLWFGLMEYFESRKRPPSDPS
jgi:hypothetical protein